MPRLEIIPTDFESALQLRCAFSDPPRSRQAATSPGDTAADCVHFGAYLQGQLVGVCSVGPEPLPILHHPDAWRGRGLAVLPSFQDRGVGLALVQHQLRHVEMKPNPYAWSYAKRKLIALYSLLGYCPTGYTHMHPVSGETLLFGNEHTRRLIQDATGISYAGYELPVLGAVNQ